MRIVAGLVAGLFAGAFAALALAIAAAYVFNISQMEGAYAMGVAFFWMPLGAAAGALVGTVLAAIRKSA